ncbi:MAG: hypothetical protein Ct9H300mP14_09520 [Gammaproteobacteria bacterium]|nr:MAG: hypothetical protein Ct9H300mP14_09520 [Gammaproteobacteria bacterium]
MNLHDAIEQSCDVYFYHLAHSIGIRKMADYFGGFGFGQRTGIDLRDEPSGLLPTPEWKKKNRQESWYPGETIITGIGQGYLLVTPLQLAYATARWPIEGMRSGLGCSADLRILVPELLHIRRSGGD